MESPVAAALCALIAVSFWTVVGLAIPRHLLPRPLALGAATVIGWAIHSAAALPVYMLVGFSTISVIVHPRRRFFVGISCEHRKN
jgi:hypothetical protein